MFRTTRSVFRLAPRAAPARPAFKTIHRVPCGSSIPLANRVARYSSKSDEPDPPPPKPKIDYEAEREIGQRKLGSSTKVSTKSSVRQVIEPSEPKPPGKGEDDAQVSRGLSHDFGIIRDTFRLDQVPRESHILGLAGTIPYLATSLSTVFLTWDLNKEWPTGNQFYDHIFIQHDTARYFLDIIEPLQLGYGAVIISFLGAIHWGLEYAEKQPLRDRTRFRYGIGLAAPIVAWPTLLMPIEYGLTTQFMAFVGLYFVDSNAARRGWAPYWYGTYRFLLTAMVGAAIFVSLVGRAKMQESQKLSSQGLSENMSSPGIADHETNWAKLEEKEKARIHKEKEEAEKKAKKEAEEKKKAEKKSGKKGGKKDGKDAQASSEKQGDDQDADSKKKSKESDDDDSQEQGGEEEESGEKEDGSEEKQDDKKDNNKKQDNSTEEDDDTEKDDSNDDGEKKKGKKEDASKGDDKKDSEDDGDGKEKEKKAKGKKKD